MRENIQNVLGRRVWDSRGCPTIEVEVHLEGGAIGRAVAPAGASRGMNEACDLRDGGNLFGGRDVNCALADINTEIAAAIIGLPANDQLRVDQCLLDLDGTENKTRFGGSAMIATSMATAWAAAAAQGVPLWRYLSADVTRRLPLPEIQIFGGGAHAAARVDVQDFMVIAVGAETYSHALDMTAEVYLEAGKLMSDSGLQVGVADEGGFWPMFDTSEAALDMLVRAIEKAGFRPGEDMAISLDIAASEFHLGGAYQLALENRELSSEEMIELLVRWINRYPIISIEDPLGETDEGGLISLTVKVGDRIQIIGDDYLVTNADRVRKAQTIGACNAVLVKPNQAGTLTETRVAIEAAHAGKWDTVMSARSGETEDTTIVHLAVGWGTKQLKVGSFSRSERLAKWNEGLRIADAIGHPGGRLPNREDFRWNQ